MRYLAGLVLLVATLIRFMMDPQHLNDHHGRHRTEDTARTEVPPTYHPLHDRKPVFRYMDVPWNPLWKERMVALWLGQWSPLTAPLNEFYDYLAELQQEELKRHMGDWRWMDYPTSDWPLDWQQDRLELAIAGSDLPARGSELVPWTLTA